MKGFKVEDDIYSVTYGNFSLPQFQMLGIVLIVVGLYMIYLLNYFFLLVLPAGLILSFLNTGIQVDLKNRKHREYLNCFGILFGKWKEVPAVDYVTVYIEHYSQRSSVVSIDSENQFEKVKVSLIIKEPERLEAGLFDTKEKGLEAGKLLAKQLKTKLLDFTTHEPGWVEL